MTDRIPMCSVTKDGDTAQINASDLEAWQANGWQKVADLDVEKHKAWKGSGDTAPEPDAPAGDAPADPDPAEEDEVLATEAALTLMADQDIDPALIAGSGAGGKIIKTDVEEYLAQEG